MGKTKNSFSEIRKKEKISSVKSKKGDIKVTNNELKLMEEDLRLSLRHFGLMY